jgi:hypothetical protein
VLPLGLQVWHLYSSDTSLFTWIVSFAPLFVGFVLPAILLWLTYAELRKRTMVPSSSQGPALPAS